MRRVTSRPRLFSWDQFDATARTDPHQEDPSSFSFHIPVPPAPVPIPLSEHQDGGGGIFHHHDNNHINDNDDDDDDDLDSDYMSCLSQSLHSNRRYSNHGNCSSYLCGGGGGVGPCSRSSSMLSLKNLSAHMSLEDEDDCSSRSSSSSTRGKMTPGDTRENSSIGTATAAAMRMVGSKDPADASFTLSLDITADDTCSSTSRLPVVVHHHGEATATNVVSPPGTPPPRCGDRGCHHSMTTLFLEEDVANGHCSSSNKKRNLDDLEKSVCGAKTAAAVEDGSIPSTTTTSAAGTATAALPFNLLASLQQDVFIDCLQYLSLDDLKSLSITCSGFYHLLTFGSAMMDTKRKHRTTTTTSGSNSSSKREEGGYESSVSGIRNVLWWNWIRRQWPELALAPTQDTSVGSSLLSSLLSSQHDGEGGSRLLSLLLLTPCNVQFVDRKSEHQGGVVVGGGGGGSVGSHRMNYIALMSCAQSSPTCIAGKYFEERPGPAAPSNLMAPVVVPVQQSRPPLFRCFNHNIHNHNMCSNNGQETVVDDGVQIVQYIGDVGIADRSICTNRPFPKPILKNGKKWDDARGLEPHRRPYSMKTATASSAGFGGSFPFPSPSSSPIARLHGLPQHIHNLIQEQRELASNSHRHRLNIFERLRGCNMYNHSVGAVIEGREQQQQHHWSRRSSSEDKEMEKGPQSFVSPYVSSMKLCVEIDLTPRMMAYFEVSILRKDDLNLKDDMDEDGAGGAMYSVQPRPRIVSEDGWNVPQNQNEVHSACVAVGLSTQGFRDSSRMPGWDSYSYGYHGDDGGIFHSHGEMIRVYGPTYNVGDTVGCGVNYLNGGIFYTLNGNFLGYAWVNEKIVMEGKADLYPTVGLDSADPIACNFGNNRPFVFNFAGFVANDGNMPISGPIAGNP